MDYIFILNSFVTNTFEIMKLFTFTPFLLIGLLITSLSLILTLKNNNIYIKEFKNHKNSELFIKRIFKLSGVLILTFFFTLILSYLPITDICELSSELILYTVLSIVYLLLLVFIAINLLMIVSNIKNIVLASLKD